MFRIVRKSRERLITEAFEARLAERERLVQLLIEQIEYLRAQVGLPTNTVTRAVGPAPVAAPPELDFSELPNDTLIGTEEFLSEDEEQLLAMRQADVISLVEYEAAREALKRQDPRAIIE